MKKILAFVTALIMICLLAFPAGAANPSTSNNAFAAEVLRLVNIERARQGLPALSGNNTALNAAAQRRAVELNTRFAHTRPNGSQWHTVMNEFAVGHWVLIGENIAAGQSTPAAAMNSWMASTGHRNNIMGQYTHMGVGVYRNSNGTYHWVQLFLSDGTFTPLPWWGRLPVFIQWFLRIFVFGWIWMR